MARRGSQGVQHSGRGGAGNVLKGEEADKAEKARQTAGDSAIDDKPENKDEPKGLAAKGMALLGLGGKKE